MRFDDLIRVIASATGVPVKDLLGQCNRASTVEVRQCAMWLWCRAFGHSTPRTADLFGKRDHTTVMHACRRVDRELAAGRGYRAEHIVDLVGVLVDADAAARATGRIPSHHQRASADSPAFAPLGMPWGIRP